MEIDGYTKLTKTGEHIAGGSYIDPLLQDEPALRDVRSDIYSLSAIMFFLLCGRTPIGGDIQRVLRESNSKLSDGQVDIVLKSLSIDINRRFSSCEEMKDAIEKMIQ